jgi:hypothetical protein
MSPSKDVYEGLFGLGKQKNPHGKLSEMLAVGRVQALQRLHQT